MNRILALSFINKYKVAQKIQPGESKTFKALADECGLDEVDMRRILRLGMTEYIFTEPEHGLVAHSVSSLALITAPNLDAWTWNLSRIHFPAAAQLPDALGRWPGAEEPSETAFATGHGQGRGFFEHLTKCPEEAELMAKAMDFNAASSAFSSDHFVREYDFSKLPTDALFVDVGGSHGGVAIRVANSNPSLRCIVQDLSEPAINAGKAKLPEALEGRVDFMVHNFWKEQPVRGADVYFFRFIFHDWADSYVVKILKNLVPALKKGSRVVINDICVPSKGTLSLYRERSLRSLDCMMKAVVNGKEREEGEWRALLAAADSRFTFQQAVTPPGSIYAIIEAVWDP